MNTNRRGFLTGAAYAGVAAAVAGCKGFRLPGGSSASLIDFAVPPMKRIRVGVVGVGSRGEGAVHRLAMIPGVEVTGLCDWSAKKIEDQRTWFAKRNLKFPTPYTGSPDCHRRLCDAPDVDVVYNATGWPSHVPVAMAALESGKHVLIEVPAAPRIEDCWRLVETAEKYRLHCMQLENDCYERGKLIAAQLAHDGTLGEITHADGSYIHYLTDYNHLREDDALWRLWWDRDHSGDPYPTHGLMPIFKMMDINCGDRLTHLVSMGSQPAAYAEYGREHYPVGDPHRVAFRMPDVATTLIQTAKGRSITITHDVSTPRPGEVRSAVMGTKGYYSWDPTQIVLADPKHQPCKHYKSMKEDEIKAFNEKHMHQLWRVAGDIAKKVGGHGGLDFIMDLRWVYCLQNGLPLDQSVYDLAASCSVCELSERSCLNGSAPQEIPDFTRGAWRTAKPRLVGEIDPRKMGLDVNAVSRDNAQLNV